MPYSPAVPLVRIDVVKGWPETELRAISDSVHRALVETLDVPERDRFQIVTEHAAERFMFDRSYLDVERSERFVFVHVTLAAGRSTEAKQRFYALLDELLVDEVRLRPEDLGVMLVENGRQDWSFGNGLASYLVLPRERWR